MAQSLYIKFQNQQMYMMKSNLARNKGDTRKITKYHSYSSIDIAPFSYLNPTLYTSL